MHVVGRVGFFPVTLDIPKLEADIKPARTLVGSFQTGARAPAAAPFLILSRFPRSLRVHLRIFPGVQISNLGHVAVLRAWAALQINIRPGPAIGVWPLHFIEDKTLLWKNLSRIILNLEWIAHISRWGFVPCKTNWFEFTLSGWLVRIAWTWALNVGSGKQASDFAPPSASIFDSCYSIAALIPEPL